MRRVPANVWRWVYDRRLLFDACMRVDQFNHKGRRDLGAAPFDWTMIGDDAMAISRQAAAILGLRESCNHIGQSRCDVCAPVLTGKSGEEQLRLLKCAIDAMGGATPRLCNACRHWHYAGKGKRSDCRRLPPAAGVYPEMKGLQTCSEWEAFPARGQAPAALPSNHSRVVPGGLRESGPA